MCHGSNQLQSLKYELPKLGASGQRRATRLCVETRAQETHDAEVQVGPGQENTLLYLNEFFFFFLAIESSIEAHLDP
jgi:hypothetical protein